MEVHLEHEFFFNPDGRGKVRVRWTGPIQGPDPNAFIAEELRQAKGVEAWRELSCAPEGDRLVFQATAYFQDIAALRFHCQGLHVSAVDFTAEPGPKGALALRGRVEAKQETPVANEADIPAAIAQAREQMKMGRDFIEGMFGGLRCSVILRLPGKIGTLKNAKKLDESSAATDMSGRDLIAIFDRLMTDDDLMAEMLRRGGGPDAMASLLGDLGPAEIATKGKTAPLFDYDAEVAEAAAAFEELRASLAPAAPAAPVRSAPAGSARVVACKLVREADNERELHPFGQNYTGYSCVVAGELEAPALKAEEGVLEAFVLDDGQDVAPPEDWDRRIHFPKLTQDGLTVFFELGVKFPGPLPDGIREIRGAVTLHLGGATEEVELGFPALEAGAIGTAFDARLERCETSEDGRTSIELRLALALERIRSVSLVDKKGKGVELSRLGYSASGDECTLTLEGEAALKKGMSLKARVITDLKTEVVPFRVENVDLLGRPR